MKRSVFATGSYCQLLRQWTRHTRGLRAVSSHNSDGRQLQDSMNKKGLTAPLSAWRRTLCTVINTEQQSIDDQSPEVFKIDIPEDTSAHVKVPFRTSEDDPTKHNLDHEALFYNVHKEDYSKYFQYSGQWPDYLKNVKSFNECAVMVRSPALEACDIIDNLNLSHPAVKILFYGKLGSGKTLSLAHVVHTQAKKGWFLVDVPMMIELLRKKAYVVPEFIASKFFEGTKHDLNEVAVLWLKFCKLQNSELLETLKTTKEYSWTERESAKEGTSLSEIATFGTERRVFASDCIGILLRELKIAASDKRIKLLVAIDGVNGLFQDTKLPTSDKKLLNAQDITMFHYFANMMKPTWSNGVCVGTLCQAVMCLNTDLDRYTVPYTPQALLQKKGFSFMDPFIPILVPEYSNKEVYNCIEYYIDRKWLQRPRVLTNEGKKELVLLSNRNPLELMNISSYW